MEQVSLISSPSELIEHYVEPALRFLEKAGDMDGVSNSSQAVFAPVLANWTQVWTPSMMESPHGGTPCYRYPSLWFLEPLSPHLTTFWAVRRSGSWTSCAGSRPRARMR